VRLRRYLLWAVGGLCLFALGAAWLARTHDKFGYMSPHIVRREVKSEDLYRHRHGPLHLTRTFLWLSLPEKATGTALQANGWQPEGHSGRARLFGDGYSTALVWGNQTTSKVIVTTYGEPSWFDRNWLRLREFVGLE
jgi:hypothetical protein